MALKSVSLRGDGKLEAAARSNPDHILAPAKGVHVSKIQRALMQLDDASISRLELNEGRYGPATLIAVQNYKDQREVINKSYQQKADAIVGIMTMAQLDKELKAKEDKSPDFLFFSDAQRAIVEAALDRARTMLDVTIKRLRAVSNSVVSPRNAAFYETKLDILKVFHINTFRADDLPIPDDILETLRPRIGRVRTPPEASSSPVDAFSFAFLLQNFLLLRKSLDEQFRKEFWTMNTFNNDQLGLFEAFVSSHNNFSDTTLRIRPLYFDDTFSADHRAMTLAHERAHTIFHAQGHPGTGDNPFCVAPHAGDPNVTDSGQALANPYCYEWLMAALQPNYSPAPFLQGCVVTAGPAPTSP